MAATKAELIQMLMHARQVMLKALEGLSQTQEIYESWQLKHFLAHLTGWQEASIASLRAFRDGGEYEIPAFRGIDEYNESTVDTRRELSYDQIFAEWQLVFKEMIETLDSLPEAKLEETLLYPWGPRGRVEGLIRVMAGHELEHAEDVMKLNPH